MLLFYVHLHLACEFEYRFSISQEACKKGSCYYGDRNLSMSEGRRWTETDIFISCKRDVRNGRAVTHSKWHDVTIPRSKISGLLLFPRSCQEKTKKKKKLHILFRFGPIMTVFSRLHSRFSYIDIGREKKKKKTVEVRFS